MRGQELLNQGAQTRRPDPPRGHTRGRSRHQRGPVGRRSGLPRPPKPPSGAAAARSASQGAAAPADAGSLVTQYYKDDVEQAGLVKFDFLGSEDADGPRHCRRTRRTLGRVRAAVPARRSDGSSSSTIRLDDARRTSPGLGGDTRASSSSSRAACRSSFEDLRPDCFEDIVAAVALYRPGRSAPE